MADVDDKTNVGEFFAEEATSNVMSYAFKAAGFAIGGFIAGAMTRNVKTIAIGAGIGAELGDASAATIMELWEVMPDGTMQRVFVNSAWSPLYALNFLGDQSFSASNPLNASADFRVGGASGFTFGLQNGVVTVTGTSKADTLRGKESLGDIVNGAGGNDRLTGLSGNDVLRGGDGDDFILGGGGRDRLEGGNGDDTMQAASGGDRLIGGAGLDLLTGGDGSDVFYDAAGLIIGNRDLIRDFQQRDTLVIAASERVITDMFGKVVNGHNEVSSVVLKDGTRIEFAGGTYDAGAAITAGDHANLWNILG